MSNQQRLPAGTGSGGQFTAHSRPASTVRLAEADEWVFLSNPDDPDDLPIYEGPAGAAGQALIPGDYTGFDEDAYPVSVTVRD